jgi:hypothetical protein
MKTKWITFLLLLILACSGLAACEGAALTSSDPNVSGVQAYATLEYVHAVQTSTAQAQYAAEWRATAQAGATQDVLKAAYVAARAVDCPDAVRIPESRPGLAYTDRWGLIQTYYLDKQLISQMGTQIISINGQELQLAKRAIHERKGKMSIPLLVTGGLQKDRPDRW